MGNFTLMTTIFYVLQAPNEAVEGSCPEMEVEHCSIENPAFQESAHHNKSTQTDSSLRSPVKATLRRKIKTLQSRIRRREKKIENFSQLISELKTQVKISSDLEQLLTNNFSGFPLEFILNTHKNSDSKTACRYSDTMKQFSLTLHFCSPKAYRFLRKHFPLPHPNRLKSWITNVNCKPGYLDEVFNYLQLNKDNPSCTHLKECSLVFDSMSIRKQLIWDNSNQCFIGKVDLGGITAPDCEDLAKDALVFQLVSYTKKFRCPVAYYLTNGISSFVLAETIRNCLIKLQDVGVTVRSITCDGTAVNLQALNNLGCKISPDNLKTFFKHPSLDVSVHAILDPCHMLKLVRNALAEKHVFTEPDGEIKWSYITKLQQLQHDEQLKFANNLSPEHIKFQNKKMNVSLAAQTLSSSVADAIEFLDAADHPEFNGSTATVLFLRRIDKMFDILNCRSAFGKGYKQPLNIDNMYYCQKFFEEMETYLLSIKIEGIPAVYHARKTFVLGFIVCMKSVVLLGSELLFREVRPLNYFLTYKLSQDHIELLFACIRARGGWNNNPNCQQFQSSIKALLLKNCVSPGNNSNVIESDFTSYLPVNYFKSKKQKTLTPTRPIEPLDDESVQYFQALDLDSMTDYQNNILYYIAGFVCRKVVSSLDCQECIALLLGNEPVNKNDDHNYSKMHVSNCASFTMKVSRGGLTFASELVFNVIQFCEKSFRQAVKGCNVVVNKVFINKIVKHLSISQTLAFSNHSISSAIDVEDLHGTQLIKRLVSIYMSLRGRAYGRSVTIGEQKTYGVRQKLTKIITFSNV